ncbi:hypothetical protein ISCGN_028831 [Ixodes scapularis]
MAWLDYAVATFLHNFVIPTLILAVCLKYALRDHTTRRLKLRAWLSNFAQSRETGAMLEAKEILFDKMKHVVSRDANLRNLGLIRVLEIGGGAGHNLVFYPKNCHVIAVDSNPFVESYLRKNVAQLHVLLETFLVRSGDSLADVPTGHVDVVVTTHVLCGVDDVNLALKEIARVLVPGGKFFYVEHMRHDARDWRRYVQLVLDPLWRRVFGGCRLTRDLKSVLETCGHFASVSQCKIYSTRSETAGVLLNPVLVGIATKRQPPPPRRKIRVGDAWTDARHVRARRVEEHLCA